MLRTAIKGMGIIRRVNIGYSSASLEASQAGRRASLEASQSGAGNNWLKKEGTYKGKKFSSICHFFGYQARGSLPSKSDCNYAYGARFSLSQQVENFQNTLNQLKNMMGEEELRSHLANSLVTMILGSNDYINNYLQPLFYSSSYIYTLTAFADLLIKLYTKQILDQLSWGISRHFSSATSQNIHIDWRSCGVLNKIRKQSIVRGKKCHSCYAMAATCTVEAVLKIQKGGELEELSVQELLDCSRGYGNYGCGGGRIHSCYKYIISNGISREVDYPYKGEDGCCDEGKKKPVVFIHDYAIHRRGFGDVKSYEWALIDKLREHPVAVSIVNSNEFKENKGNIIEDWTTNEESRGHAIVLVGAITREGKDVWVVRNSHGETWGDGGYGFISRELTEVFKFIFYPIIN